MPRRPNYRFERSERNRAKEAKREEKLKRQQERAAGRDPDEALAEQQAEPGQDNEPASPGNEHGQPPAL